MNERSARPRFHLRAVALAAMVGVLTTTVLRVLLAAPTLGILALLTFPDPFALVAIVLVHLPNGVLTSRTFWTRFPPAVPVVGGAFLSGAVGALFWFLAFRFRFLLPAVTAGAGRLGLMAATSGLFVAFAVDSVRRAGASP